MWLAFQSAEKSGDQVCTMQEAMCKEEESTMDDVQSCLFN